MIPVRIRGKEWRRIIAGSPTLRIVILATPRSGNTWLHRLLAGTYGIPVIAAHTPADINWSVLPQECIVQIHWHRTHALVSDLEHHGFRMLALARHPLDVLISILHFAPYEPLTAHWLGGEGGNEQQIYGVTPLSAQFLTYATSPRAAALLSISPQWWTAPGVVRVRYEDLVFDTNATLEEIARCLDAPPRVSIRSVTEAATIHQLRIANSELAHHFWRGQPGLWRRLLPSPVAREICLAHQSILETLRYYANSDEFLKESKALANWEEIR